jgi:phospholipase D1/2
LAIIVRDDEQMSVKLDGVHEDRVSLNVHHLRVRLWRKLFGLMGAAVPAHPLAEFVSKPAAKETWEAIQRVSHSNALAYRKAFPYLTNIQGKASSIWPTWDKERRRLEYQMPFNERFWRADEVHDESFSWDAKSRATEISPTGIQGFIVALPVSWTEGENNLSDMNLTLMATRILPREDDRAFAGFDEDGGVGVTHRS